MIPLDRNNTTEKFQILIADDDEIICEILKDLLNSEGYEVTVRYRGDDALCELQRRPYHLVLLDLEMPGLHGIEVMKEIKKTFLRTDVVIITAHASVETAVVAIQLGAQDYLTKPFKELDIVLHVVRKTLIKRRLQDENERLYAELKVKNRNLENTVQRLSSLNEMSRALHTFKDINELLTSFVEIVAAELKADRVSLMLLDRKTNTLILEAAVGIDRHLVKSVSLRVGEGIAGSVMKDGRAVLVKDIENDARFRKSNNDTAYNTKSFISAPILLSVPIKYHQQTLGVINVNNKRTGGAFVEDDLDFVSNLASQAAVAIANVQILKELKDTHFEAIIGLAEALEAKDAVTRSHSDRMLMYALRVAERLGLSSIQKKRLRYLAVLHDIGKIGIPEQILLKPGELTSEEYLVMKKHPLIGAEIVEKINFLSSVAPLIRAHHEWYDGNGYPEGIAGDEIPVESRIVAVLDAFDAMTSDRPYRKSMGIEKAVSELRAFSGSQFDPLVVEKLIEVLRENNEADRDNGHDSRPQDLPSSELDVKVTIEDLND